MARRFDKEFKIHAVMCKSGQRISLSCFIPFINDQPIRVALSHIWRS